MKIGVYSPYLDTMTGGERYILTAASCLSDKHEVSIFWDDQSTLQKAEKKLGIDLSKVSLRRNIFSPHISLMKRLSKSYDYDVIIYLSDGSIPLLAAKKTILHFQFPVEWVESKTLLSKLKLKNIKSVVCNSNFTKSFIDSKFSINSKVIYPPVQMIPVEGNVKKENLILTVGRFSLLPNGMDYKKQIFLIDTFKKLVDNGIKDWKLVVLTSFFEGGKDGTDMLKKQAAGYPIEVVANLDKTEVNHIYGKASIYWHATGYGEDLSAHPDWAEHFGISTVEAMSAGCVPVVIKAGGQKEIIREGENGYLWESEEELLDKTKKLIGNKTLLKKLISEPSKLEEMFGVEKFSHEFHKIIL